MFLQIPRRYLISKQSDLSSITECQHFVTDKKHTDYWVLITEIKFTDYDDPKI